MYGHPHMNRYDLFVGLGGRGILESEFIHRSEVNKFIPKSMIYSAYVYIEQQGRGDY